MLKLVAAFLCFGAGALALGFNEIGLELLAAAGIVFAASLLPGTARHRRSYERGSAANNHHRQEMRDGHVA